MGKFKWANYSSYFTKFEGYFASSELRRELKEKVTNKAIETYTPMSATVNTNPTFIFKKNRMSVSVNDKELKDFNNDTVVDKLVIGYDKLPLSSDVIDSAMLLNWLDVGNINIKGFIEDQANYPKVVQAIDDYFNDKMSYKEVRDMLREPTRGENEEWSTQINVSSKKNGGDIGNPVGVVDEALYKKHLKLVRSKINITDEIEREENMRKGKAINRGFVNKTSYKPLVSKTTITQAKKKIFILIDASGSMTDIANGKTHKVSEEAAAFAMAITNSGLFDVDHVVWHDDEGWINNVEKIKKGNLEYWDWGSGEGFEYLEDNLQSEWVDSADYVLVLTDLCIGSSAQEGLYKYIKHRKNMILSFREKGTLKGLNVRTIEKGEDLVNALTTLVN